MGPAWGRQDPGGPQVGTLLSRPVKLDRGSQGFPIPYLEKCITRFFSASHWLILFKIPIVLGVIHLDHQDQST